ncbi:DUF3426 domain-containing protein [Accumulibacter sp.]|uniref:DUF3426 domain-containing protein n=1 Tax=Accumulibacter sp. TaxID=2053492 RepID=UPI002B763553|nr:DUF3426 domain-containing protein [Accumulibacter sp.]HRF05277.1 DUF3426 domain-containing protein [Accumulibacter sp.]
MKTCCPGCQTIFRVTSEQLKVRAGKVRCGQCRRVFNALDSLLDDAETLLIAAPLPEAALAAETLLPRDAPPPTQASLATETPRQSDSREATGTEPAVAVLLREEVDASASERENDTDAADEQTWTRHDPPGRSEPFFAAHALDRSEETPYTAEPSHHLPRHVISNTAAQSVRSGRPAADPPPSTADPMASVAALAPIGGAEHSVPDRENKEVPNHDRWLEAAISQPVPPVAGKAMAAPFVIVIVLLTLTLIGQTIFHFRGVIALTTPSTRPALAALSAALGTDIPLPRHVDLVSIEASDLQSEPGRNKRLVLLATLRNRASYAQAYPAIELTLTDTTDKAIVRRVFTADEYLTPAQLAEDGSFNANADLEVRLWLDASEVNAAGYRLYVFYP